jgi:hypothetical protein
MQHQYQVALSFAGEQRDFAEQLARVLDTYGVKTFYDQNLAAELWGENLAEKLYQVYAEDSRAVVMLISGNYVALSLSEGE